jgi:hypothetical protein
MPGAAIVDLSNRTNLNVTSFGVNGAGGNGAISDGKEDFRIRRNTNMSNVLTFYFIFITDNPYKEVNFFLDFGLDG